MCNNNNNNNNIYNKVDLIETLWTRVSDFSSWPQIYGTFHVVRISYYSP